MGKVVAVVAHTADFFSKGLIGLDLGAAKTNPFAIVQRNDTP
jgi:hypothetical protein